MNEDPRSLCFHALAKRVEGDHGSRSREDVAEGRRFKRFSRWPFY